MARTNFGFDKRQKELKRKKKSEEKRQRILDRRNAVPDAPPASTPNPPTDSEANKPGQV
jgi:hypothetical protein